MLDTLIGSPLGLLIFGIVMWIGGVASTLLALWIGPLLRDLREAQTTAWPRSVFSAVDEEALHKVGIEPHSPPSEEERAAARQIRERRVPRFYTHAELDEFARERPFRRPEDAPLRRGG